VGYSCTHLSISQIGLTGRLLTRYCQCPTKGDEAFRATHREGQGNTGHSTNLRPRPKVLAWRRNPARLAPPDGCQCITQPRHLMVPQALPELLIPVPNRVLQGLEELRARKDLASRVELKVDTAPVTYTTDDGLHQGPMACRTFPTTVGHFRPKPLDLRSQLVSHLPHELGLADVELALRPKPRDAGAQGFEGL
jgi:hypothetical protein